MERIFDYTISDDAVGMTIRDFLYKKGYSRQNLIALKKIKESILLNGKWEYVNSKLQPGDHLRIHLVEADYNEQIVPVNLPFNIIYEDEDIMVINKPANMPTHPSLNNYDNTLANAAAYYFKELNIPYTFRCINRLDKDTTGLTILAKHMVSAGILSNMVKNREITREYRAIVSGIIPNESGTIDAPIGRVNDSLITRQIDYVSGERAVTHYHKLEATDTISYVSLTLETGRTHQIRVHMASIGCPLLGDYLYHPAYMKNERILEQKVEALGKFPDIPRQALHAYRLVFLHPITGKQLAFTAPLPNDMQRILDREFQTKIS